MLAYGRTSAITGLKYTLVGGVGDTEVSGTGMAGKGGVGFGMTGQGGVSPGLVADGDNPEGTLKCRRACFYIQTLARCPIWKGGY